MKEAKVLFPQESCKIKTRMALIVVACDVALNEIFPFIKCFAY